MTLRPSLPALLCTTATLVLAGVEIIGWVVLDALFTAHVRAQLDADLLRSAQRIVETRDALALKSPGQSASSLLDEAVSHFEGSGLFIEARFQRTGEFVRSRSMRGLSLPELEPNVGQPAYASHFPRADQGPSPGVEHLRLVALDIAVPADAPYRISVARSGDAVDRVIQRVRGAAIGLTLLSLPIAGVLLYRLTGQRLSALSELATRATALVGNMPEVAGAPGHGDTREIVQISDAVSVLETRLAEQARGTRQLVSNAAHALRTPLAVLLGSIQMLRRERPGDSELHTVLDECEEEVRGLLRTVESFLLVTRAQGRDCPEQIARVSMEEIVLAAVRSAVQPAARRGVRIMPTFEFGEQSSEPVVSGDAYLLRLLADNLLSNAVRNSPPGETVEIEVSGLDGTVSLEVRDRGPGIAAENLPKLFDMFYQVSENERLAGKGGVGLAVVRAVVELHHGEVSAHRRDGGGTAFQVKLPVAEHEPLERAGMA